MITAIGQIKHGNHKGSWTFIADCPGETTVGFTAEDVAILDDACEEYAIVKIWQGEENFQWWPTDIPSIKVGVAV